MTIDLGVAFVPFLIVAILGTVNGVNLTDGLDGLAGGVTLIVAVFFLCWYLGEQQAQYCLYVEVL